MDGHRFDALTQALSSRLTRRDTVALGLNGAFALTLLSQRRPAWAAGRCRAEGEHCNDQRGCCDGAACIDRVCVALERCGAVTCGVGEVCCNESCGICIPPDGGCTQEICGLV